MPKTGQMHLFPLSSITPLPIPGQRRIVQLERFNNSQVRVLSLTFRAPLALFCVYLILLVLICHLFLKNSRPWGKRKAMDILFPEHFSHSS